MLHLKFLFQCTDLQWHLRRLSLFWTLPIIYDINLPLQLENIHPCIRIYIFLIHDKYNYKYVNKYYYSRNIFLFLLEKLPRQDELNLAEESNLVKTKNKIANKIKLSLSEKTADVNFDNHEPFCACYQCYPTGKFQTNCIESCSHFCLWTVTLLLKSTYVQHLQVAKNSKS